jgi:hypothetical protein
MYIIPTMRSALVLLVFASLQSVPSKQPVVQNQGPATKTDQRQQGIQNKSAVPNGTNGPHGSVSTQNKEAEQQNQPDSGIYPVKIISQPSNPTDPWVIGSVLISGVVALIAVIGLWLTRKQLRIDQRAWVGVHSIKGELEIGQTYVIVIELKNTGKTPAKNLKVIETSRSLARDERIRFTYDPDDTEPTAALLMPTGVQRIRKIVLEGREVTPAVAHSIATGEYKYVVYGTLTYSDVFGEKHWLRYYSWLAPDGGGYPIGPEHNDTGDGDPPKE